MLTDEQVKAIKQEMADAIAQAVIQYGDERFPDSDTKERQQIILAGGWGAIEQGFTFLGAALSIPPEVWHPIRMQAMERMRELYTD